ncbi:isocitrate lyase/PEP mutase family protein [Pseudonocardia nigra]|uniref:isocitrate lyase/PEP mutase family protein n=1 Tax=Pseudonocardia nigra TaxID=1921578 RepID=UPI001C5CFE31|nr:isocitrate lyase/phosphoenolpyruvate mutase family protein [Pseudonocardia nigra]
MSFRDLHHGDRPLLLPNAWDVASAVALVDAGFAAVGTTSLGVAAAHGVPDAAGLARAETAALARKLVRLPVPVTVDVEAGFSADAGEVGDLAAELASFGVAGINLEDGRSGGVLADARDQVRLLRVVKERAPALFVNARTDTHWFDPAAPLDSALARCRAYADAGADGVFVPGLAAPDQVRALVAGVDVPVNLLHLPGRTTVAELAALGVRRISTGSLLFRVALGAAVAAARAVRDGVPLPSDIPTYADVQRRSGG